MANFMGLADSNAANFRWEVRHGVKLLYRSTGEGDTMQSLVIPHVAGLRQLLLEELHCTPLGGHLGVAKLLHLLR